ncbi:MAG: hypothetical protein V1792_14820 [Pseudomonadota bacterium]
MCFKYQACIRNLGIECPPDNYEQEERDSFRFVKDTGENNNFLPPLVIKPKRIHSGQFKNDLNEICSGYALSFFDTLDNAIEYFAELRQQMSNAYKSVGTHIARGLLAECDGVMSNPDSDGHFDLHEFAEVALEPKFSIVHDLQRGCV